MARLSRKFRATVLSLATVAFPACGKDAPKPTEAEKPEAAAPTEAAAPEAEAEPELGIPVDAFVAAHTLARCAQRFGASEPDARTLAVDQLAGRPMQDPEAVARARKLALAGVARDVGAADRAAELGKIAPVDPANQATETGIPAAVYTPGGRVAPRDDDPFLARYVTAVEKAQAYPKVVRAVDDAVATCHFSPKLGLVAAERIEAYVSAFVDVACLGEQIGKPGGPVDTVAHARAAAEIFRRFGMDARGFSQFGLEMARFDDVTAKVAKARSSRCPDPRAVVATERANGRYRGTLSGPLSGRIEVQVDKGDAKGTLTLAPAKKKTPAFPGPVKLVGVIDGRHVHLQGGAGPDWIRLDADHAKLGRGRWEAMIGQRKLAGLFALEQEPPPKPAAEAPAEAAAEGQPAPPPAAAAEPVEPASPDLGKENAAAPEPEPTPAAAAPPTADAPAGVPAKLPSNKPGKPAAVPK